MNEPQTNVEHPRLIQGGMGIGVSWWEIANPVSRMDQLGVVSGTGADVVFARLLQLGDHNLLRALGHFPHQEAAKRIIEAYYVEGGIPDDAPFKEPHRHTLTPTAALVELNVAASFCLVWLAKEGHDGVVGINFLETIQLPHVFALYGAMLAGVDYVIVGAGVPLHFPRIIDALTRHEIVHYEVRVTGATREDNYHISFDPKSIVSNPVAPLRRPFFLPIVSAVSLAQMLCRIEGVDGFIVEATEVASLGPLAGGHNAGARGKVKQFNAAGEPIYGPKDVIDYAGMVKLGKPFWVAGAYCSPERMKEARDKGAYGIQAGTIFALCNESRIGRALKVTARRLGLAGTLRILNNPKASPKGFPFHVALLPGSLTDAVVYEDRPRNCNLGGLCELFVRDNGTVGYRCRAEPLDRFRAKGGDMDLTVGCYCLCNALLATIGLAQRYEDGYVEPPVVTLGNDVSFLPHVMTDESSGYSAQDAVEYLLQSL
jgi:NAD(P)H-dependent flavin oxidoreductase YrpB (nitropropane dioxygenase family)